MKHLVDAYRSGCDAVAGAIVGLDSEQLRARPIPGKWSTLEVVCHLSDSEMIFAERMKRILIEDQPPLRFFDPSASVATLAYHDRNVDDEVTLICLIRRQMAAILRAQPAEAWQRTEVHSKDGRKTLKDLVEKAVAHLQHHLATIAEKRRFL